MRKSKFEWEKWGLYTSLLLLIVFTGVFGPRRLMKSTPPATTVETEVPDADSPEAVAPVKAEPEAEPEVKPALAEAGAAPQRKIAQTKCGEKPMPKSLLTYPNPLLKSHVGEFEKESSSFLERSKLKTGVSVVLIQDLCPQRMVHFSFHYPEKGLVAKAPDEAYRDYGNWVSQTLLDLDVSRAFSNDAAPLLKKVRETLASGPLVSFLFPTPADWGGVQITFKTAE